MRLILTILLIGLFKAEAQIVINASAPYRPVGGNLLLDQYTGSTAAYSFRKLRTNYTGAAIRVRKDTTGQPEQDINFLSSGELDTAAMKSFVGNNSAFITTWYSQSESINNRNAIQPASDLQPRIINAGTIQRVNNKISISFDGVNDLLRCDSLAIFMNGEDKPLSIISVCQKNNTNTQGMIMGFGDNVGVNVTPLIQFGFHNTGNDFIFQIRDDANVNNVFTSGTYAANTQYLASLYSSGLSFDVFANNASQISNTYNRGNVKIALATIGALRRPGTTSGFFGGSIQEVIFYNSNQNSSRTGIETNINTYYSIY